MIYGRDGNFFNPPTMLNEFCSTALWFRKKSVSTTVNILFVLCGILI